MNMQAAAERTLEISGTGVRSSEWWSPVVFGGGEEMIIPADDDIKKFP